MERCQFCSGTDEHVEGCPGSYSVEPRVDTVKVCDMGREAFEAFHRAMGGPPPVTWDDLETRARAAWYRAARAAFDHFVHVTAGLRFGRAEDEV